MEACCAFEKPLPSHKIGFVIFEHALVSLAAFKDEFITPAMLRPYPSLEGKALLLTT